MISAIILAAGKSERMGGGVDKAFLSLNGKPVVAWSLLAFEHCADIDQIVLVVRKDQLKAAEAMSRMFGISKLVKVVSGGSCRQESVMCGLSACDADTRKVVIHDGARPLVKPEMIAKIIAALKRNAAVTLGRPVTDTIKRCEKSEVVCETVSRANLWSVQTPQGFDYAALKSAYAKLKQKDVTDDCMVMELAGGSVKIVESLEPNVKITVASDLALATALMR